MEFLRLRGAGVSPGIAMAEAFRNGNLGVMDYYKLRNIQADTEMRENIAKPQK